MRISCPNCGFSRDVPPEKLPKRSVRATCPKCSHKFPFTPEEPETHRQPDASPATPPTDPSQADDLWEALDALRPDASPSPGDEPPAEKHEDPEEHHSLEPVPPAWEATHPSSAAAYLATLKDILFSPGRFFRTLPVGAGYTKPLLFFLILAEAMAIVQALWHLLGILPPAPLTEGLGHTAQATLALILYPLQISFFLFLDTIVNHFFLHLFRGAHKGFEGTFRAQAYSAAPMVLLVIPYLGLPMAVVATTVYKFLALRHVHGTDAYRVLGALVVPVLLMLAVAIALTWLAGTMA